MKQAPLPIVSGRYFFPKAPLLCLKWISACAVTSVKRTGPEVRTTLALCGAGFSGTVAGAGFGGVLVCVCSGIGADFCLQPEKRAVAIRNRQQIRRCDKIGNPLGR